MTTSIKNFVSLGEATRLPEAQRLFAGGTSQLATQLSSKNPPPICTIGDEVRIWIPDFLAWLPTYLEDIRRAQVPSKPRAQRRRRPRVGAITPEEVITMTAASEPNSNARSDVANDQATVLELAS
ncbi:hypothetical protein [Vitreimonas flagellata]|uniref:hypothetical protein n=1 Tax=Vitreimonas flagellata TaxID=2560861 RepID=UPI001074EBC2|nr:hypothetical protein [Vitreimonas flagellata]